MWPPQSRRTKSDVMVAASRDIPIILPAQKTIIEQIIIKPSLTSIGQSRASTALRRDLQQETEPNLASPVNQSQTIDQRP